MKDEDIISCLDSMSEDDMTENVIVPLYKARFSSFHDIEFTGKDKREDEGIDITYYEIGRETRGKEYCGIQVKQGEINTGKGTNGIAAIGIQAQQAFDKKISNATDKKNYRIQAYTVLTTGDILPKARGKIVDQFEHKNIRFVDGKNLCKWIRENWFEEMKNLCSATEEDEEDEDVEPVAFITGHLRDHCSKEIREIRATYEVVDGSQQDILKALMLLGHEKATAIAARLGQKVYIVQETLDAMQREDLIDIDEDGYSLGGLSAAWSHIMSEAEERIGVLGYDNELSIEDIIEDLF